MLDSLSDRARTWLLLAALVASSFGAGAGFMGWVDVPGKVQHQASAISILADNQQTLAEQLAVIRCRLDELPTYDCDQLQRRYRQLLDDPDIDAPELPSREEDR